MLKNGQPIHAVNVSARCNSDAPPNRRKIGPSLRFAAAESPKIGPSLRLAAEPPSRSMKRIDATPGTRRGSSRSGRRGLALARRLDGSTARRLDGSTARRLGGSADQRISGSADRRLGGSAARRPKVSRRHPRGPIPASPTYLLKIFNNARQKR